MPVEGRSSEPPPPAGREVTVASGDGVRAAEPGSDEPKLEPAISRVVRCRIRHFTDGAVIGSRDYVDEVFRESRRFFGPRRKNGARKPRGALEALRGEIWSARDLRLRVG